MKPKQFFTIYKITNKFNGKIYIGKHITNNPNDDYYGSGVLINEEIGRYGKENFSKEILFIFDNKEDMERKEREIVDKAFIQREDTYNLVLGGHGGGRPLGYKPSKETMNKIAEANKRHWKEHPITKEKSEQYSREVRERIKNDPNIKIKMSEAIKRKWQCEEYRRKHAESMKKWREETGGWTEEQKDKLRVPHSQEWSQKISESLKGKPKSEEHKRKLSERRKGTVKILNIKSGETKFIPKDGPIPDGYVLARGLLKRTKINLALSNTEQKPS